MSEQLLTVLVRGPRDLAEFEERAAPLAGRALRAETYGALRLQLLLYEPTARTVLLAPGLLLRCAPAGGGGTLLRLEHVPLAALPPPAGGGAPPPSPRRRARVTSAPTCGAEPRAL